MASKTILFGGSGLSGPVILEQYPDIISVGRKAPPDYIKNQHIPIKDLDDLGVLDSLDFDKVIFLVGNSNHHLINTQATMGLDFNVAPLKKALHYFQNRKIKKFLCFSTILLYDAHGVTPPVAEDQPINPYVNDYVFSKHLSEEVVKFYKDRVPTIVLRLSNIYGPTTLIRPDLIPTLVQNLLLRDRVEVWNKKPIRDFLYLADAAEAIVKLLDTDYTGVINLGSGRPTSVGRIAEILGGFAGKEVFDLGKEVSGPMSFWCDISLLTKLTGWQPKYSMEDGLKITYERMREFFKKEKNV